MEAVVVVAVVASVGCLVAGVGVTLVEALVGVEMVVGGQVA